MRASTVWRRVYSDFLMPSRLGTYRDLLGTALAAGYTILSIEAFWRLVSGDGLDRSRRYLVLRHDVDTDPGTARAMFAIERALAVPSSSYYFRLSTLDVPLMRALVAAGSEAGYHYEELATVAKRRRLRTKAAALAAIPEAQRAFLANIVRLRREAGLPLAIASSHGDFANRLLDVPNWLLLADPSIRARAGIELETYDHACMRHVTSRHADTAPPRCWTPADPLAAIARHEPVMYLLVHPRHWRTDWRVNARDDAGRMLESLRYRLPAGRR